MAETTEKSFSQLTDEEKEWLCGIIDEMINEETTDRALELGKKRLRKLLDEHMPWYGKALSKVPFLPDPADMAINVLDEQLPEIVTDPLKESLGCTDAVVSE